jgi:AAA family ATP:ADP antiporter
MSTENKESLLQILSRPSRLLTFITGVGLIGFGLTNEFNAFIKLGIETLGWCTIVFSIHEFSWGVKPEDLKKFIPLSIMFFVIVFTYTICRQAKDNMIISKFGVEVTGIAKLLVFVFAYLYQMYYIRVSRNSKLSNLMYWSTLPIIAYFFIFAFFLQDNPAIIASPAVADAFNLKMAGNVWVNKIGLSNLFTKFKLGQLITTAWHELLFYIFSEIYAVSIVSAFFWYVANRCTKKTEIPVFYPALMIIAQISSLSTGHIIKQLCKSAATYSGVMISTVSIILALTAVMYFANYYFFQNFDAIEITKKKEAGEVNIMSTIKKNPIFLLLALLVVWYGFSTVFLEQFWKDKMQFLSAGDKKIYAGLNSSYFLFQSRISIVIALFGSFFMKKMNWLLFASLTPLLLVIGSIGLFGVFMFPESMIVNIFGSGPMLVSYWSGFVMVALFKSLKYGSFDTSKEKAISSQQPEYQREIKNLEGLFGRVGKTFGSWILLLTVVLPAIGYRNKFVATGLFVSCITMGIIWLVSDYLIYKDLKKNNLLNENN